MPRRSAARGRPTRLHCDPRPALGPARGREAGPPALQPARAAPGARAPLDIARLLVAAPLPVREVEAQLVGTRVRPRLTDVRPEAAPERGVEEVRGRVVALRGMAGGAIDDGPHALAGLDRPAFGDQ